MNFAYTLHEVGRDKNRDERREENQRSGELAAALARPWRRSREPRETRVPQQARGLRGAGEERRPVR